VASGVATIETATVDQFVPQMLNYELLGGVDFKKGCYPGQEIVARSQYRGTIKRRTFLFNSEVPASAGQEVFHSDDPAQPAGLVANAAGNSALIELKLSTLGHGSMHLGAADGPRLSQAELPYDVPIEAG
jgi:folate-binding protein YgfZ